jgi:hypothetical protein
MYNLYLSIVISLKLNIFMELKQALLTKGYDILDGSSFTDVICADSIEFDWLPTNIEEKSPLGDTTTLNQKLSIIHYAIGEKFLKPYSYILRTKMIWESPGISAKNWHSDYQERANVFFLLYFNDMTLSNDGALLIRNNCGDHRIVPTPGMLVAMENTNPDWQHRVEDTKSRRVTAYFGYLVDWNLII